MGQGKLGWWIVGACGGVLLISIGYGMGRRANPSGSSPSQGVTPAGAPLPSIQIEPIQPHEEMAAITATPATAAPAAVETQPNPAAASPASAATPAADAGLHEDSARVREIQQTLKKAGFDPGPIDGQWGQKTRTAVHDFQQANGLEADGKVGPKTWSKLESYLSQPAPKASNN